MNGKIHLDNTNRYLDNLDNLDNTNRNKLKRKEIPYINTLVVISSVQFSRSVVSDSLRPHELQQARPPCPSPLPEFTQTHVLPLKIFFLPLPFDNLIIMCLGMSLFVFTYLESFRSLGTGSPFFYPHSRSFQPLLL